MTATVPPETGLVTPVLDFFSESEYWRFHQVALGRKRIDLVFVSRNDPADSISVELKVRDWRKALWQASVNLQLVQRSYIGLWHGYTHRVMRNVDLLKRYGVGLIAVSNKSAEIVFESCDPVKRLSRDAKRLWYLMLVDTQ